MRKAFDDQDLILEQTFDQNFQIISVIQFNCKISPITLISENIWHFWY